MSVCGGGGGKINRKRNKTHSHLFWKCQNFTFPFPKIRFYNIAFDFPGTRHDVQQISTDPNTKPTVDLDYTHPGELFILKTRYKFLIVTTAAAFTVAHNASLPFFFYLG